MQEASSRPEEVKDKGNKDVLVHSPTVAPLCRQSEQKTKGQVSLGHRTLDGKDAPINHKGGRIEQVVRVTGAPETFSERVLVNPLIPFLFDPSSPLVVRASTRESTRWRESWLPRRSESLTLLAPWTTFAVLPRNSRGLRRAVPICTAPPFTTTSRGPPRSSFHTSVASTTLRPTPRPPFSAPPGPYRCWLVRLRHLPRGSPLQIKSCGGQGLVSGTCCEAMSNLLVENAFRWSLPGGH